MPDFFIYLTFSVLGLVVGSFLSALTYRMPLGVSIAKGRSFCPKCKNKIAWIDNIPIVSFYLLKGKCRNCGRMIPLRYPLIEFFTLITLLLFVAKYLSCQHTPLLSTDPICSWNNIIGSFNLLYQTVIAVFLVAIFVIDFEKKIIPDKLSLGLLAIVLTVFVFFNPDHTYENIFYGFVSGAFLLLVHLVTKGKGMGLGDVKLAIPLGIILGWPYVFVWFFLSFVIGSVVGLFLIAMKKTSFGKEIPFGPFLIIGFILTVIWSGSIPVLPF